MNIKFYDILLTLLKPFVYITGQIGLPHHKITGAHYFKYRDSINIGDVFLTKSSWELSNITNPCKFKHGAFYVGNIFGDEIKYVFESTAEGAVLTNLVDFLLSKDIVVICELKRGRVILKEEIQNMALKYKGIPYDYLFSKTGRSMYCFELVAVCLLNSFPELKLRSKEIIKGKEIYSTETFLDEELFTIKIDSRKDNF